MILIGGRIVDNILATRQEYVAIHKKIGKH